MNTERFPVAIIGSGNIGTDLMIKILRSRRTIDHGCDDRHRPRIRRPGPGANVLACPPLRKASTDCSPCPTSTTSDWCSTPPPRAHTPRHWEVLRHTGVRVLDLTPAAIGPFCVPVVNLEDHIDDAPNLNMVTCGGQATVPIVAAVHQSAFVSYAEIVSSMSSKSAGPGTRANIDEFIETTATALRVVGGAQRSKTVMILNPADPPILMRNTVYCLVEGDCDHAAIDASITAMVNEVQRYVPGYKLKQPVQFESFDADNPLHIPETGKFIGTRVTAMLQVTGAADYLPAYAGNLDIMTSAALATAERIAAHSMRSIGVSK